MSVPDEPRDLRGVPTAALLDELARRFRVRFGAITASYHDGRSSERVEVMHRVRRHAEGADRDEHDLADQPTQPREEPDDARAHRTTERGTEAKGCRRSP